jgi:nicotinate-nucleotide adenylyltransferase
LIIGQDSFNTLETWKDYQQFGDYAQPVILPRTADTQKIHTGIFFSKTPLVDISSTQIRNKIRNQQDLSGLLPGDFFKPCPSRVKAGFKKSPSG